MTEYNEIASNSAFNFSEKNLKNVEIYFITTKNMYIFKVANQVK